VELKDADGVHSPDGDPILSAQRAELRSVMESAVKSLPDGQREVVLLHGMQGLSYSEVAEVLACPVGTVKSRLSTAFRRLRETLTPYVNGDPTLGPAVVEAGK
jgi:RNA polymerase sigma-70 factor (ECF subfamily)